MKHLVKRLTFAGTLFIASHFAFIHLVDFVIWFTDEDQTSRYKNNKEIFDFIYDIGLPYVLASLVTIKYILKVFYIPTLGEAIRWLISFIIFSWGWVIIKYLWSFYNS